MENPLSRPRIGAGPGTFSFIGDVNSNTRFFTGGPAGIRIILSSYLDEGKLYSANFYFIRGALTANQEYQGNNLNFRTDVTAFGASFQYEFGHWIPPSTSFRPFLATGLETFQFNPKGDLFNSNGDPYPWLSGDVLFDPSLIEQRDQIYETNLRNPDWSTLDNYSKFSFAVPVELGFTMDLAPRISLRMSASWHFTFSDNIDNYNSIRSESGGNRMTDLFRFTSVSLLLDPFSEPKTIRFINLYQDVDTDPIYLEDEDGDMVLDFYDECPGTPSGAAVDTLGCPLDGDRDGVPDYYDIEPDTPYGKVVGELGESLPEDSLLTPHFLEPAVSRKMLAYYLPVPETATGRYAQAGIPEIFREFDNDGDSYISFDELLGAIDRYFDYETSLDTQGIYDLINFFFSQ